MELNKLQSQTYECRQNNSEPDPNFLAENRQGPVNHACKMLEIKIFQDQDYYISLTNETSKMLYHNLSRMNNAIFIADQLGKVF